MEQQGMDASASASVRSGSLASAGSLSTRANDHASVCPEPAIILHADWRRELRQAIVQRVLPRLSAMPGVLPPDRPNRPEPFPAELVVQFADAALGTGLDGLLALIDRFMAGGATLESVFLDLLSPAARHLGDLWLADRLSFFDVTAGLGRLQAIVRALGPNFEGRIGGAVKARRILLSPVAGENHVFGLSIVAAFFRRAGWIVTFEPVGVSEDLIARVRTGGFDAVGLSAAGDGALQRLPAQIQAIRRASGPRGIAVLAGGPAFLADPDLGRQVGADAVARDATEAVRVAEAFPRQPDAAGGRR